MEVVASIIGSFVAESSRYLFRSIYGRILCYFKTGTNLNALQEDWRHLMYLRADLKQELDEHQQHENLPRNQVEDWLRRGDALEAEVNEMLTGSTISGEFSSCSNCTLKYKLSRKVVKKLGEVKELVEAGSFFENMVIVNEEHEPVEHIPCPSIIGQKTASQNLARIMELLSNDKVKRIGVYGMGGVGKTTLLKNLNNELNKMSTAQPFSVIIWATVSREPNLRRIQAQIAERLNLQVKIEESEERMAIRLHNRLQKEKRVLIVFDDVWTAIDLDLLGIPRPEDHRGMKIILTSRSLDFCREMMTDVDVEVNALSTEEAWELFCQHSGEVVMEENIRPLAEAVAKECCGLPLAITVVGAYMRGKSMAALWKDALSALKKSAPVIKGIEDKVFKTLKWSYDSLQDEQMKSCFLFCCLFPEDYSIKLSALTTYWLSEGLLDDGLNYEERENRGIAIVQSLRDSCLLEQGMFPNTVKMHDVVRDVGIWIACSSENTCRSIVRSGLGLTLIPENEFLSSLKRVSFMKNMINQVPDCILDCPEASTLFLQGNHNLIGIPQSFLQGFKALKILDLSQTKIETLPLSLLELDGLRALLLHQCFHLKELPSLESLTKLQVLVCSDTMITRLPEGLELLTDLRLLDLSYTRYLQTIPSGTISRLSNLEYLNLVGTAYGWGLREDSVEDQTTFEELMSLKKLVVFYVELGHIPHLSSNNINWSRKIINSKYFIGDGAHMRDNVANSDGNCVFLSRLRFSQEWIGWSLCNATSLKVSFCEGLKEMFEKLAMNSISSGSFSCLRSLNISYSHSNFLPDLGGNAASFDLLPNLEEIYLHSLSKLRSISDFSDILGLRFSKLKIIDIFSCPQLQYLLSHELSQSLSKMEEIRIESCSMLKELFRYPSSSQDLDQDPSLPNLQVMKLRNLPNFQTLCRYNESWNRMQKLEVLNCSLLRKLPITAQNAGTVEEIRGQVEWLNRLEWESEDTKGCIENQFIPIDHYGHV